MSSTSVGQSVRSYEPSPSIYELRDNPDDPRFKIPALPAHLKGKFQGAGSHGSGRRVPRPNLRIQIPPPALLKRKQPEVVNAPPYPNLQPPKNPAEVKEYFRKLGMNTKWEKQKEAADLLMDLSRQTEENKKLIEFTKTPAFERVFGKKKKILTELANREKAQTTHLPESGLQLQPK